jgi:hypothetical protein
MKSMNKELRLDIIKMKNEYICKYEKTGNNKYLKKINLLEELLYEKNIEDELSEYEDELSECEDELSECGENNIRGVEIKFIF